MTVPVPPRVPPPPVANMPNGELDQLVRERHVYRGLAVFELGDRAKAGDLDAAQRLAALSQLPLARSDRIHRISLAWGAIAALLSTDLPEVRRLAYDAFTALPATEQRDLLEYLKVERIESAHPGV